MSKITIAGNASGTGTLQIAAPNTSSDYTLTLPAETGTIITTASTFAGTGPAFSAYSNTATSVATATFTKVTYDVENFDTNNNFASSRFTPTVAGYYQINANTRFTSITAANNAIRIYKNGSGYVNGASSGVSAGYLYLSVSSVIYLNGSTDYVEIYVYQNSGSSQDTDAASVEQFSGVLVRAA